MLEYSCPVSCLVAAQIVPVNLSFTEAALGCKKKLEVTISGVCENCRGMKGEPGSHTLTCPKCNGTGQVCALVCMFLKVCA